MKPVALILFCVLCAGSAMAQSTTTPKSKPVTATAPLYVIDGKAQPEWVPSTGDASKMVRPIENIDASTIDKIEVLNGQDAIDKYGDAGKHGVVIITLKKK